jgi:tetratricopeptide (TPR) repeat protein
LTDYAFFLHFKKEFSKAIDMHKEALEMLKAIFSTELHIKVIQSYNNLAISLHDATREAIKSEQPPDILFNQATEYYEKALLLARALQKQEHFEWSLLINYGSLLTDFGLPYEGYQKYQAAIAMKNRISVNPHRNPADLFFNCAVELKHIGLYEEASFLLSEAFEIFKKLYGMASPDAKRTSDQLKEIKSFAKLRT